MASTPSKFDFWRRVQSEPGQRDMASRPSNFDFWICFQSEPGQRDMASRPSKFDFWRIFQFQSEPGQRDMASRPSQFDFWSRVQSEPGQRDMASRPSKLDFFWEPSKLARLRCVARVIGLLGDWRDVAEMLNRRSCCVTVRLQTKGSGKEGGVGEGAAYECK